VRWGSDTIDIAWWRGHVHAAVLRGGIGGLAGTEEVFSGGWERLDQWVDAVGKLASWDFSNISGNSNILRVWEGLDQWVDAVGEDASWGFFGISSSNNSISRGWEWLNERMEASCSFANLGID